MSENTSGFYQIPLSSLDLPSKYAKLIQKIIKLNNSLTTQFPIETIGDVLEIEANKLSKYPHIGNLSIEIFIDLKRELQKSAIKVERAYKKIQIQNNNDVSFDIVEMITFCQEKPTVVIEDEQPQIALSEAQLETQLNKLTLSPQYEKLIQRISRSTGVVNTVKDILKIDPIKFSNAPAVGKLYVKLLMNFQNELVSEQIEIEPETIEEIEEEFQLQITLSLEQLKTPLNRLILSPQYEKLIKRISSSMGVANTVQDILDIDPIEFSNVPAVGTMYVELLINLQNEFVSQNILEQMKIVNETAESQPQITLSLEQLETPINQLALSTQYQRLISKIATSLGNVNTVRDILNIDHVQFSELPAVGKTYIKQLIEFQKKLPAFLENQTQKSALFTENHSIELSEIDNILIEDVEGYLWTLDERKMDIALSRWGFNQSHESMEEIGKRYGITKAAIGNIEKPINTNLPLNIRIQPKVLWANIREKMTDDLTVLLPNLAQCFASEKLFYDFIERCCQVESGSISKIIFTEISSKIINSFFCFNPSPISQEIIVNELMSNYGYSKASAVNGLKQLAKNDRIEITVDGIYPKKLARPEAVAHVLIFHPAGLPGKDISRILNKKGYSSALFNESVTAGSGFHDSEYVYLCGKGTFRHLIFLDLEQFNIPEIMQNLLDYFEQRKLNALHLHDYYQQNKMQRTEIEYFTLRHIVRVYGEEYGVFFNGQSGSDSISIDKNAKRIIQADVIVNVLNESSVAMTKQEIAEHIRSKSANHATFLLNGLMEEGKVIRVDHLVYTTPEKAFSKIDVDAVMQIIKDIVNVGKVVEADVFREYVNIELNLSYSKYIYAALIRTKLNELGWYRNGTLFGKYPIPYNSLVDMCRQLCKTELSNSENAKALQQNVWLTHSVTLDAIQQWKWQMNQAGNNLVGEME